MPLHCSVVRRLPAPLVFLVFTLFAAACAGTGADDVGIKAVATSVQAQTVDATASDQPDANVASDESSPVEAAPIDDQLAEDLAVVAAPQSTENSVWLADLTWTEVAERIGAGATTIIIPTGGTEQNGPHLALDKHNVVVAYTAEQIALNAGNTLVAPVMAYVPEGDVSTMSGHLQWAGTISVPEATFDAVLDATARSLRGHGFTTILLLGDSGSSQAAQAAVADRLSNEWSGEGTVVANMSRYYSANGQTAWLSQAGISQDDIGAHAGVRDTSEVLALAPELVRTERAAATTSPPGQLDARGVDGDPTLASAEYGAELLALKVSVGVAELVSIRDR